MISNREYQKRQNWAVEKDGVFPPCNCCEHGFCPALFGKNTPDWWKEKECKRFSEAAAIRWGHKYPVGFPCRRLNRWILGLSYRTESP